MESWRKNFYFWSVSLNRGNMQMGKKIVLLIFLCVVLTSLFIVFKPFHLFVSECIDTSTFIGYYDYPSEKKLTKEECSEVIDILPELKFKRRLIIPFSKSNSGGYEATADTLELDFLYNIKGDVWSVYHVTLIPNGKCWAYDTYNKGELFDYIIVNPEVLLQWAQQHYSD